MIWRIKASTALDPLKKLHVLIPQEALKIYSFYVQKYFEGIITIHLEDLDA